MTTERNVRGDGAAVAWVYHHTTITTELCLSPEGGVGVRTGRGMSRLLPGERLMLLLLRVEGRVVVLWRLGLLDVRQHEGRAVGRGGAGLGRVIVVLGADGDGLRHGTLARLGGGTVQHHGLHGGLLGEGDAHVVVSGDGVGVAVVGRGLRGPFLLVAQQLLRGWGVWEVARVGPLLLLLLLVLLLLVVLVLGSPLRLRGVNDRSRVLISTRQGLSPVCWLVRIPRVASLSGRAAVVAVVGGGYGGGWGGRRGHLGVAVLLAATRGAPVPVVVVLGVGAVGPRPLPVTAVGRGAPGVGVLLL